MKKYYYVGGIDFKHGKWWFSFIEYHLIKEGWIRCNDYKEDPNDSYYITDSLGTPGTRKDYCEPRNEQMEKNTYETSKEAKQKLKEMFKDKLSEYFGLIVDKYQETLTEIDKL